MIPFAYIVGVANIWFGCAMGFHFNTALGGFVIGMALMFQLVNRGSDTCSL